MKEIWKDLIDYEGAYQVSDLGRVKSLKRYVKHYCGGLKTQKEAILKPYLSSYGYSVVGLFKKGIQKKEVYTSISCNNVFRS